MPAKKKEEMTVKQMEVEVDKLEKEQARIQKRKRLLLDHIAYQEYLETHTIVEAPPPLEEDK